MKSMRKLLASLLVLAMVLVTITVPAYADATTISDLDGLTSALSTGGEYILGADVVFTSKLTAAAGKTTTIDLNGHNIYRTSGGAGLLVNGTLTIKDSSKDANGYIGFAKTTNSTSTATIVEIAAGATLNLQSGGFKNMKSTSDNAIVIKNSGTFNMTGGYITTIQSTNRRGLQNHTDAAVMNLTGGMIYGNTNGENGSDVFLYKGTVNIGGNMIINGTVGAASSKNYNITGGWFSTELKKAWAGDGYSVVKVSDESKKETPYTVTNTKYEVTYDCTTNGGTTPETGLENTEYPYLAGYTVENSVKLRTTKPVGPDGYIFKEWNTSANGEGTAYAPGAPVTLTGNMTLYAIYEVGSVIAVDSDLNEYMSLNDAFDVEGSRTITLIKDVTDNVVVPNGAAINLNLNGHNITGAIFGGSCVKVYGTLNLYNAPAGENAGTEGIITGYAQSTGGAIDILGGTFRMFGGTVQGCATKNGAGIIAEKDNSKCYIYGGTVKALAGDYKNADGTVASVNEAVYGKLSGTIIEIGGTPAEAQASIPKAADIRISGTLAVASTVASAKLLTDQTVYYSTNVATGFTLPEGKNFVANKDEATSAYGYKLSTAKKVTYALNGGTVEVANPNYIATDDAIATVLNPAAKAGYTFDGWYDGDKAVTSLTGTEMTEDVELTAKYTIISYTISYEGLEGATNPNTTTSYTVETETITLLPAGEREGFAFCGWTDAEGKDVTEITKGSTGNVVLTANWGACVATIDDGAGNVSKYGSLADAVTAAAEGDTIVLVADCTLDGQIKITKNITLTTDGKGDHTIYINFTDGWAIDWGVAGAKILGTEDSQIIIDGSKLGTTNRTRGLLYVHAAGCEVKYVTIQNCEAAAYGGGLYVSTSTTAGTYTVIDNCTVKNCISNHAEYSSMAVLTKYVKITNCIFENNINKGTAAEQFSIKAADDVQVTGCKFVRNNLSDSFELMSVNDKAAVSGCTFDVKKSVAISGGTIGTNTYNIAAPTQAETTMVDTGAAIALTDIFDGYDADTMNAAIKKGETSATEINGVGTYTITVSPKEEHFFPAEATTEFTFTVEEATKNVAEVNTVKYKTFGEAINAATAGDTITLLDNIDSATINKKVVIDAGTYAIASATVTAAALPLDISKANITSVTFDADVENNIEVFVGDETAQTITNEGKALYVGSTGNTIYSVANAVAKISDTFYASFADAIAAAVKGDTVIIINDLTIPKKVTISKAITVTTDGNGNKTVTGYTSDWLFDIQALVTFGGASDTSRLVIDGEGKTHSKGVIVTQGSSTGSTGSTIQYVTIKNNVNGNEKYGGAAYSNKKDITYNYCNFENNKSSNADGGNGAGFYGTADAGVTFNNCNFTGNQSARHAGAVYGASGAKFTFNECTFTNNTCVAGKKGGVSYINKGTSLSTFNACTFTGNSSNGNTANALYCAAAANAVLKDCTFTDTNKVLGIEGSFTDNGGNTFTEVEIALPTLTKNTAAYTGLAYDPSYFVSGIDLKKMDVRVEGLLDELLPAGEYTIVVDAKEGYVFTGDSYSEKYNVTITAPEGTGSTKLFMSAEVRDTITAVFFASVDADTVALYDNIVLYAKLGNGEEKQLEKEEDGNGNYTFRYRNIYSQRMNDKLTARIVGIKSDNTEVVLDSITDGISIADYCNIVATNELYSSNTKLLTFMANMLAFGDACQAYANYNAANPATAGKTWITALIGDATPVSPVAAEDLSKKETTCNASITAAGLNIENKISVYFMVESNDAANTKVKVGFNEYTITDYPVVGGKYMITLTEIEPTLYNDVITAEVYIGETLQHTVKYSVNTYCARMAAEDGIGALAKAIYNYGVAAAAYVK